ncbi:MAG: WXG100 family type VII secretion target [Lachnospira sp.]
MAIAYEKNTDLAFDTEVLRQAARDYGEIATDLRKMSTDLDDLILKLKNSGWTTPAGTAFYEMTETNWSKNIEKYASLLDTLENILKDAASDYDTLMTDYVRTTKVSI